MTHHWANDHAKFIRMHFTEELGSDAIYIRTESELGLDPYPHDAGAYTSTDLDLTMKNALQAHGQWGGRGFAMALPVDGSAFHRTSWPLQINLCLHELAHHLADRAKVLVDADPQPLAPIDIARGADVPLAAFVNVYCHGPEFVRAGLHVHKRASPNADLYAMQIFAEAYKSPALCDAQRALDAELRHGGDITDIMATPAPAAFTALWPSDEERTVGRYEIHRRILDSVWAAHGLSVATP